jgi:cytochrome c-type biogenesis protein CcmF
VLVGTLYPLALEGITGEKISVGPPFFNMTFIPLMMPLLFAMPFGPLLAWKRGDLRGVAQRLAFAGGLAVLFTVVVAAMTGPGPWLAPICAALGLFVLFGAVTDLLSRARFGDVSQAEFLRRVVSLPRSAYGTALAHAGIGIMVLGIVGTSAYQTEKIVALKPGERAEVAGYDLLFKGIQPTKGPNYSEQIATFEVTRDGAPVTTLLPSKRLYNAPPQPTTEAGIYAAWTGDLYVALGDEQPSGGVALRLYFHPLVRLIWIGAVIMFIGGAVSLSDRRLRVGAPQRARSRPTAVPAE